MGWRCIGLYMGFIGMSYAQLVVKSKKIAAF